MAPGDLQWYGWLITLLKILNDFQVKYVRNMMLYCLFILLSIFNAQLGASEKISIFFNNESPTVKFTVDEVKQALKQKGKITIDQSMIEHTLQ